MSRVSPSRRPTCVPCVVLQKEYRDLADQLSDFAVRLLERVWTQQELEVVLNKKGGADDDRYEDLARLKLALANREKSVSRVHWPSAVYV